MNQRTLFQAVAGLTLMTALTACTPSPHKEAPERQIGMANPASVYCLAQKGQLDMSVRLKESVATARSRAESA